MPGRHSADRSCTRVPRGRALGGRCQPWQRLSGPGHHFGARTKVVVAEENRQLARLQRLVQLRQPVVRQLAGAQKVLQR